MGEGPWETPRRVVLIVTVEPSVYFSRYLVPRRGLVPQRRLLPRIESMVPT